MVDTADIFNAEQLLVTFINERYPTIDTRKGTAFRKLVLTPAAAVYALINEEGTNLRNGFTPDALENEDDSVVEAVLSNWYVSRKTGENAVGVVKVSLSEPTDLEISEGTLFRSDGGQQYSVVGTHQYSRTQTGSGFEFIFQDNESSEYFVLVPVEAVSPGSAGNLEAQTILVLENPVSISNVLFIETYTQFSQGTDPETIDDYKSRVQDQLSVRNLVTKKSIRASLLENLNFVQKVVAKGYGDPEMIRDITYPARVHVGGAVDVYVSTGEAPNLLTLSSTLSSPFIFTITEDNGGPIYRVNTVSVELNGVMTPLVEDVDYSITYGVTNWPVSQTEALLQAGPQGRLSRYEKIDIEFLAGNQGGVFTNSSELVDKSVLVECDVPVRLDEVQTYLDDEDENKLVFASLLAKALFPVYVNVALEYQEIPGQSIDESQLAADIASYVRGVDLSTETIATSKIIAIAESYNIRRVRQPVTITTDVVTNYGVTLTQTTTDEFSVEDNVEQGFSREICQAFCNASENVTLNKVI